jgi:hypothetical protein
MDESDADLEALQHLIDASYARAGSHLLSIHEPARRLSAVQVAERLHGVCLLALATVTADGRPIVGPVDGLRRALLEIYVPRFGPGWEEEFLNSGPVYARIDPERMFTFAMPA